MIDRLLKAMKREESFLEELFSDEELRAIIYALLNELRHLSPDMIAVFSNAKLEADACGPWRAVIGALVRP